MSRIIIATYRQITEPYPGNIEVKVVLGETEKSIPPMEGFEIVDSDSPVEGTVTDTWMREFLKDPAKTESLNHILTMMHRSGELADTAK
jgi:hypothetical protein